MKEFETNYINFKDLNPSNVHEIYNQYTILKFVDGSYIFHSDTDNDYTFNLDLRTTKGGWRNTKTILVSDLTDVMRFLYNFNVNVLYITYYKHDNERTGDLLFKIWLDETKNTWAIDTNEFGNQGNIGLYVLDQFNYMWYNYIYSM